MSTLSIMYGRIGAGGASDIQPDLSWYTDVPSSLATGATLFDGQALTGWGSLTTITGTPKLATDTVHAGGKVVRTKTGVKLQSAPGAAGFMSTGASTAVFAVRFPKYNPGASFTLVDFTDGGTVAGYQIHITDNNSDFYGTRVISLRIFDGSTWILDTGALPSPNDFQTGHFIPLQDHIITVRVDGTQWEICVDGKPILFTFPGISITFPGAAAGRMTLGGGPLDYRAVELYASRLSDANKALVELRLATRFGSRLIAPIAGRIDLINPPTPRHVSFPWATALGGGVIDVTCFAGQTEAPANVNTVLNSRSLDEGLTWSDPVVIYQSDGTTRYADPHTLKMSNGHLLRIVYTYDSTSNGTKIWSQKSTNNGSTWSSLTDITSQIGGTPAWLALGGCPVEDPDNAGHVHFAIYTKESESDTGHYNWHTKSTDYGDTWATRNLMSNGQALTPKRQWNEPQLLFHSSGEMRALIREDTSGHMWGSRSLDKGTTWATFVDLGIVSSTAGQSYMQLSGAGDELWIGRGGPFISLVLYYRLAGAAYDAAWENAPDAMYLDPRDAGAMGYGTIIELTNELLFVWASTTGNAPTTYSDVCSRRLPKWVYKRAMPGSVTPATASINVGATQQLTVTGAGEFSFNVTGGIGGTVDAAGVFTAGTDNGTATATVMDQNGKTVGTCVFTVSGAVVGPWDPSQLGSDVKLWWNPSSSSNYTLDVNGLLAHMTDLSGNGNHGVATDVNNAPAIAASAINGKSAIDWDPANGIGNNRLLLPANCLDGLTDAEVYFVGKFPLAPSGGNGLWNLGAALGSYHPHTGIGGFYDAFGSSVLNGPGAIGSNDLTTPFVYNAIATASNWIANLNRGEIINTGAANTVEWPAVPFVGRNVNLTTTTMLMGEFIIVSPSLSPSNRTKMLDYLTAGWATP